MPPVKRKPQYMPGPTPKKRVKPEVSVQPNTPASISSPSSVVLPPVATAPWSHPFKAPPSVKILEQWLSAKGVWVHEALQIRDVRSEGEGGIGVYGMGAAAAQTVVCKIPRSTILSSKSSLFPSLLPPSTSRQLPPIALLSLSVLHEIRLGESSQWYGYIQSLPRKVVPLVSLWQTPNLGFGSGLGGEDGKSGRELLRGTEVDRELRRIEKDEHSLSHLELYHPATAAYFPPTALCPDPPRLEDLLYAYSLVSSRAFGVDLYHGTALVPLADAFNHRDPPENHVHFESDDFVCPECGALPACSHDEIVGQEPSVDGAGETTPIPARLSHLPLQIILSFSHSSQQTLDMMCVKAFSAGDEVFNTYGEKMGWAKMLVEWGFLDESGSEGDVLGAGLQWDLKVILRTGGDGIGPEGDDDAEERYEARKKVFKKVGKAYRGTDSLDSTTDDDSLLFQSGEGLEPKDSLLLNGDGQISEWMTLALLSNRLTVDGDADDIEPSAKAEEVLKTFRAVQACLGGAPAAEGVSGKAAWEKTKAHLIGVADLMGDLIDKRVEGTSRPTASVVELLDEMDAAGIDRPLSRMAYKLLIEERRVLEVVASKLEELKMDLAGEASN